MGFVRKSSKIVLTSVVIAGMMMSSCSENGSSGSSGGIGHFLHKAWDWLTGKPPKWKREQAKSNAKAVANWSQTLSNINIKGLPKEIRQCYKTASALSGVPLPVMYAITLNETKFHDHDVCANDGTEGKNWDCGMMQVNTEANECPLAYKLAHNLPIFIGYGRAHKQLLAEIEALGLKYVGGGSSYGNCGNLTHSEAVEYCSELEESPEILTCGGDGLHEDFVPSTPEPACLSIFMGAYVLSYDMWWINHSSSEYNDVISRMKASGVYEDALQNAGPYFKWVLVAYQYNGLLQCYGFKCYFDRFARHLHGIITGVIHIAGYINKHI